MHLNPYGEYATTLAASLANEWPVDRDGIFQRTREFGMTMTWPIAPDDHERTRQVIDDWLAVVDAENPDERARVLNDMMARATAYPRLTDHDDEGWHLHYRDTSTGLPITMLAVISVGTALHLTTRGMSRLLRCGAEPCRNVIVDTTRNGRQRYCSVRCANRAAVRRHRARV